MKAHVESKKLRILLVVTSEKRVEFLPTTPTAVEIGYPVVFFPILGVVGPKGLPEDIITKLNSIILKISMEKDFQNRMRNIPLQITYQDSIAYEKSLNKFKDNILSFFKEEGLVKTN